MPAAASAAVTHSFRARVASTGKHWDTRLSAHNFGRCGKGRWVLLSEDPGTLLWFAVGLSLCPTLVFLSATHLTRLVTRTKESNMCASYWVAKPKGVMRVKAGLPADVGSSYSF